MTFPVIDRRATLTGLGAAALLPSLPARAAKMEPTMDTPRKVMWAAAMMTRPLAERLEAVAESEFTAMSIFPIDMRYWRAAGMKDAEISQLIRSSGVDIIALDPFTGWAPGWSVEGLDQEFRDFIDFSEDDIWRMADVIGAEKINAVHSVGDDFDLASYADALGSFAERAKTHGLGVAFEFMPISKVPDLKTGWDLIRNAGDDIGMIFDTWHFWRSNPDHDLLATIPGERIYEVQVADAKSSIIENLMTDLMQHRLVPGEGDFDLVKTIRILNDIGGMRSYGPETFSAAMNELTAGEAVRLNEAGLVAVMEAARKP